MKYVNNTSLQYKALKFGSNSKLKWSLSLSALKLIILRSKKLSLQSVKRHSTKATKTKHNELKSSLLFLPPKIIPDENLEKSKPM